jgi:hypothetical protein
VLVVIGIIQFIGIYAGNLTPQILEYAKIAVGKDEIGLVQVKLLDDKTMLVEGGLGAGSARVIEEFYLKNRGVKTVVLNSQGGLREAENAARW